MLLWDRTGRLDLQRRALVVAPRLVGSVLVHGEVAVQLTEVEAYEGVDDAASHAWRGPTPRSRIMFGPPGLLYVYLSHGIHRAANLVCGPDGTASAVLLRAGRVIAGIETARSRRPGIADDALARGPGCLTRALGIELADNGATVRVSHDRTLLPDAATDVLRRRVPRPARGPRIGISRATELPWRFVWPGESSVSGARRR